MENWRRLLGRSKEGIRLKLKIGLAHIGYCSKPSFLIIGTQKGGTSALHRYLSLHPYIVRGTNEIGYFHRDRVYKKGNAWYHSHFPILRYSRKHHITFESTPEYLYYHMCAERIFSYDSRMKLVVLLRDPVARAFSAWAMFRDLYYNRREVLYRRLRLDNDDVRKSREEMLSRDSFHEFDEAVRQEIAQMNSVASVLEPSYVRRGLYTEQLRRYFECFARDQVLVLDSRLLREDTATVLHELGLFLGLPRHDWSQEELPLHHVGRYDGTRMSEQTSAFLRDFYRPYNQELYSLLGHDFGWQ